VTENAFVPVTIDRPEGALSFRAEVYREDGRVVCGICFARGRRTAGPHAFARAVREEMQKLEASAKAFGAQEMRIGGRWGRHILNDYEPFPDPTDPLRRRKIL
jgi:hypothetical protein